MGKIKNAKVTNVIFLTLSIYHSYKNPVNPWQACNSKTNKNLSLLDFFSKHLILFRKGSNHV